MKNSHTLERCLRLDRHALSPIFSTLILVAIVVTAGTTVYFYATNATISATNQYASTISESQQSISERIGFENIVYTSPTLTVYVINCGNTPNLKITGLILSSASNPLIGYYPVTKLYNIDTGTEIANGILNLRQEGRFSVTLNPGNLLSPGSMYTLRVITERGSTFDNQFIAQ